MNEHTPQSCQAGGLSLSAENASRLTERFARSTLDALSTHVAILDETGKIIAVNRAWRNFAKSNQPVLVGMLEGANYLELFQSAADAGDKQSAAIIAGIQGIIQAERQEYAFVSACHAPEGKRWFNVRVTRFSGDEPVHIVVAHEDITHQKEIEAENERDAAEIRDLYENAPCGYHSVDTNGIFVRINDTELAWIGYSREELVGKKRFCDILTDQSREHYENRFPAFKECGVAKNVEFEVVRSDGTTFPVVVNATAETDEDGNFLTSRCTLFDITERKRAEAALRQSEETVRSHIQNAFDVIFTLNHHGEFVFVSPAWELHLGHPPHKVLGQSFTAFVHPDDVEACIEYVGTVLKTGQSATSPPYRFKHAKGDWRCFVANGTAHIDSKGEPQFIGLAMLLPTANMPNE